MSSTINTRGGHHLTDSGLLFYPRYQKCMLNFCQTVDLVRPYFLAYHRYISSLATSSVKVFPVFWTPGRTGNDEFLLSPGNVHPEIDSQMALFYLDCQIEGFLTPDAFFSLQYTDAVCSNCKTVTVGTPHPHASKYRDAIAPLGTA